MGRNANAAGIPVGRFYLYQTSNKKLSSEYYWGSKKDTWFYRGERE